MLIRKRRLYQINNRNTRTFQFLSSIFHIAQIFLIIILTPFAVCIMWITCCFSILLHIKKRFGLFMRCNTCYVTKINITPCFIAHFHLSCVQLFIQCGNHLAIIHKCTIYCAFIGWVCLVRWNFMLEIIHSQVII